MKEEKIRMNVREVLSTLFAGDKVRCTFDSFEEAHKLKEAVRKAKQREVNIVRQLGIKEPCGELQGVFTIEGSKVVLTLSIVVKTHTFEVITDG